MSNDVVMLDGALSHRNEAFNISLHLDASKLSDKDRADVTKYLNKHGHSSLFEVGDTVDITIDISYFGSIVETLLLIEKLIDNNNVIDVKTVEFKYGKCLIQTVLSKIEQIERRLENGESRS